MSAIVARRGLSYPATREQARRMFPVEREPSFQARIVDMLKLSGFELIYHTHDSRGSPSGFPDLVALRPPRVLFIEVKAADAPKRLPLAQEAWKAVLGRCPGVEYYAWWGCPPASAEWREITRILSRRRAT